MFASMTSLDLLYEHGERILEVKHHKTGLQFNICHKSISYTLPCFLNLLIFNNYNQMRRL